MRRILASALNGSVLISKEDTEEGESGEPPARRRKEAGISAFASIVLIWTLLFGIFVIRVVYGAKAVFTRVVFAAEPHIFINTDVIGVPNPAEHKKFTALKAKFHCGSGLHWIVTPKQLRHRLPGQEKLLALRSCLSFVGPSCSERAFFQINPNSAIYLSNASAATASVSDLELPIAERTRLNSRWGIRYPAYSGHLRKIEISDDYPRALGKYQRFFGGYSLPFHERSLRLNGFDGAIQRDSLPAQYSNLQNANDYQPNRSCYEFPLYFDVFVELICIGCLILGGSLIGSGSRYVWGGVLALFGLIGFTALLGTVAFGNPLIVWDLGIAGLLGRQTDAAQREADKCYDNRAFHNPLTSLKRQEPLP